MRIGVVGLPDGWSTQRLAAAVVARTGQVAVLEPRQLTAELGARRVTNGAVDVSGLDAVVVKKLGARYAPALLDRLEVLRVLEAGGVRVFSTPGAIGRALNRLSCTVTLRLADIPMPATVITEDLEAGAAAVRRFGRAVLKPLYTSKARGMQVLRADEDVYERLVSFRAAGNPVLYIQEFVELGGRDYGIVFLGGAYVGSYARVGHGGAWHTSTSEGGKYQPCAPSDEVLKLAERAQAPFGLDFTCVDVIETEQGPQVFEVSAFGGFRGLHEAAGIDAAGLYVDYVLRKLNDER